MQITTTDPMPILIFHKCIANLESGGVEMLDWFDGS